MRFSYLLPAALSVALIGCPPRIDTGNDGGGVITVGPEGGIFVREGAVIEIPKNALSTTVNIVVTVIDSGIPEVPGRKRISLGYRFSPSGITFKEPAKIIIPYLTDRVPQGVDPGTFDMRRQAGEDAYLALPRVQTRTEFTVVEARTDRLGLFWNTSPAEAAISKLTIEPAEVVLRVGDTRQFTAKVTDPAGRDLEVPITWSVVAPRVASIDPSGLLTAKGPGPARVVARAQSLMATAEVRVMGDAKGPLTFLHENPFPTGNDLHGGAIAGPAAFFVGANATVLARGPNDQWTRLFSSPGVTLYALAGTGPNDAVAVGISGNTGVLVEMKSNGPAVATFTTIEPRALWFDGTHGMAVGNGNDVLVRRSTGWARESSPSFEILLSVVGDGQGGFVTLGNRGSIYKYDPATKTWNSLFQTQLSVLLVSAQLMNAQGTEAWAVGGGKLWHFQTGAWTAVNLPPAPVTTELTAVGVVDGKIVIGAKAQKQGYLFVYDRNPSTDGGVGGPSDGGSDGGVVLPDGWALVTLRPPQVIRAIFASGATGYAVGDYGAVWQYGNGTFSEVSRGFYGNVVDVSVAGTFVVAAVNECVDVQCQNRRGRIVQRTGPGQFTDLGVQQIFAGEVSSVAAKSPTEVIAGGEDGQFFRWDGNFWQALPISGAITAPVNDIQFCGDTVWAVSASGMNWRGTVSSLAAQGPAGRQDLYAVHCPTDSNVWLAGDLGLYEKNGNAPFALRATQGVNHAFWRAVWSPGPGEAFAFGDARYGVYWDTAALNVIDAPGGILPEILTGLWGSSVDNLYAVGFTLVPVAFGYAVRFDGANWRLVDSGSQRKVNAIQGSSGTEIWLATEGGGLLRGVPPP